MRKEFDNSFIHIDVFYDAFKQPHCHREAELVYVLDGNVNLVIEDKTYALGPEDIILINSGKEHAISRMPYCERRAFIACFKISYSFLYDCMDGKNPKFWCVSNIDMEVQKYNQLRVVLKRMLKNYAVNKDIIRPVQMSDYYLLVHLLTNYFAVMNSDDAGVDASNRKEDIVNYIDQNYYADLGLSDLAEYMNLSASYLSRYIKKTFGMNFIDYIYEVRVEKAKLLLEASKDTITNVAYNTGFPNVTAFNRYFKQKEGITPSEYRKQYELNATEDDDDGSSKRAVEMLEDYLTIADKSDFITDAYNEMDITADVSDYRVYDPIWNVGINIGSAEQLLDSDVQKSVLYAKKYLKFCHCRFWDIFAPEMFIVNSKLHSAGRFNKLDRVLNFLLDNGMIPVIELSEKQNRIERTSGDYIKDSSNKSVFESYEEFLQVFEELMHHLVSIYSAKQVNNWIFEMWDDRRVEMYRDKQPYIRVYSDIRNIIKRYAPKARIGGAGNYLGWNKRHTDAALRMWVDNDVYPDYLTFSYVPYSVGEIQSEKMSKRKTDEDDLKNTIEDLNRAMLEIGFPQTMVFLTSWNMTRSSRNYFNDSLWKAAYVTKCIIDNLGQIDGMVYSQLQDSVTDYYDNQELLNGSAGLLTRDMIAKPAFHAFRLLNHLQPYLVAKGNNYVVTRDEYGKITIIIHNFIDRNYLYFLKEENENTLKDHYSFLEDQDMKLFHIHLDRVVRDCTYELHHHVINRSYGSILDEWAKFDFNNNLHLDDLEYLRTITIPRIYTTFEKVVDGKLSFDVQLEPLEIHCISLRPVK